MKTSFIWRSIGLSSLGVILVATLSSPAEAVMKVAVVGSYVSATPSISTKDPRFSFSPSTNSTFGGGALVFFNIYPLVELETGALYVQRKMGSTVTVPTGTFTVLNTFTDIQIPVLFRLTPLSFLSLGAGVVYNAAQGDVQVEQTDASNLAGGSYSRSKSYSEAQWSNSDLAYDLSVELRFGINPGMDFIIDANDQMGIANIDTSNITDTKINVIQVLAGVSFGF